MTKSSSKITTSLSALVIACAMAVIFAPPVGAQSAKEASASKAFYNIKGGQTVLVATDSELARSPEAIRPSTREWDRNNDTWGLQPVVPPAGLVRLKDGPLVKDNIRVTGGQTLGYAESLLVDPATGLVHYFLATGGAIGHGQYVPVPISAVDLRAMTTLVSTADGKIMTPYSDSAIDKKFPAQQVTMPLRAVEAALVPTAVIAKLTGGTGLRSAESSKLTQTGEQVGRSVLGPQGQAIGTVTHLVVDKATGEAQDAVIAVPFLGANANIVVPLSSLRSDASTFVTSQSPEQVLKMPSYKTDDLVSHFGTVAGG